MLRYLVVVAAAIVVAQGTETTASGVLAGTLAVPAALGGDGTGWESHTRILIDGGARVAYVRPGGEFVVDDLPVGLHYLEVESPSFVFEAIRIEVSATHKGRVRARVANLIAGTTAGKNLPQPLVWTALARTNYFVPRESFNIRSILMNPMMLSLVFMGGMMFLMPKLTDSPEMKEQQEALQEQGVMGLLMGDSEAKPKKKEPKVEPLGPRRIKVGRA